MAHKYEDVEAALRERVMAMSTGQGLDAERRLADEFGVSRVTVRRALMRLEDEGLVTRVHGSGTYKADSVLVGTVYQPTSFSDDMRQRGMRASYEVLSVGEIETTAETAAALNIPEGARVLSLRRLLLADDEPMALENALLPTDRFPGIADADFTTSLYDIIRESYSQYMRSTRRTISAALLDREQAALLGVEPGMPSLVVTGTTSDPYGVPMEHFVTIFRSDRYELDLTVRAAR